MALTYRDFLSEDKDRAGVLYFGGARMALLDIEAGFWGLRSQIEALVGRRLTDVVLQQAGVNGGASFAHAFVDQTPATDGAQALRDCVAAYQAAGFGRFEIEVLEWPFGPKRSSAQDRPIGRVLIRGTGTFEAWMMRQHTPVAEEPVCAYSAGVLVGFVNVLSGRHDVVCIERTCQAQGDQACLFELLPADAAGDVPVVALAPDPALGLRLNLLEMLFDRMPMGIAIFDLDYRLRRYNPTWAGFADLYASPSASPVAPGVDYFAILPGAEPIVLPLFEQVLAGETVRQEAVRLEVEGIVSYWDVVLAPLVEDGAVTGILNVCTDATNQVQAKETLQAQVAFEDLITTISTNFINTTLDEIDGAINQALQTIGEFAGVDRSCVFLLSADKAEMDCTHEWCVTGIPPQIQRMQGTPISNLAWFNAKIMYGEVIHIPRVADLPPEARAEQAMFQQQGTQSLVVVPMAYRGTVVGFLGFDSVRTEKTWSEESIKLLKIVGEIFCNALEHKRAQAMQAGQSQFLELLATGGTLAETLHALVRIIEEQWPGMLGLILLLDEEQQQLHHGASISLPEEYLQSIEGLQIGPMVGSCGTASYLGERVIVEDILTDPRWDGLRDLAIKYRLGACWSEPVFSADGRVIATFAMYYRHPRAPTEAELATIEIAAHLVGVAVEHRRAEEALQLAYQTLEQRVEERTREIERRRQVAEGLRDILKVLNSNRQLDEILDYIIGQACRLLGANAGVIYRLEVAKELIIVESTCGMPADFAAIGTVPFTKTDANQALLNRRPFAVHDLAEHLKNVHRDDAELPPGLEEWAAVVGEYFGAYLSVPLIVRDKVYGTVSLYYREPQEFSNKDIELAVDLSDQAALAIENARLHQAEQNRQRELQTLLDVAAATSSSLELDEMLSATLDRLVTLVGASRAGVMLLDGESGELKPNMLRPERPAEPDDLAEMTRACRAVISGGEPLYAPPDPEKGFLEPGALLPLRVRGQALGVLVIIGPQDSAFSEGHLALFESIADQLGVAVENARLYEQAERAAIIAERNRLARELHDSVSQALYGIGLGARTARTLLDRQPIDEKMKARLANPLDYVLSLADAGLVEMRALIFELRLDALEKEGLVAALHARHKLDIHTEFCEEPELPLETKEALYRIAQEALNNVVKHAHAGQVEIRLAVIPGERIEDREGGIALEVQDDGVGFDPQEKYHGHMGLQSMRERATRLGGSLEITSAPGRGTLLQAQIPFSGASLGHARDGQGRTPTQTA